MMRNIRNIILLLFTVLIQSTAVAANPTAQQILQKSASTLLNSGGITAKYTFKTGQYSESGQIAVKGKKYRITSSQRCIWYNGTSLWTLDVADNEVTLSSPTVAEASAMNPYLLVSNYKTDYTAKLVKGTVSGTYSVVLTPKNAQSYIKSATICIKSSDYMPVRLDITDRLGNKSVLIITDIKTNVTLKDTEFSFPANKYPGVNLVDLR